MTDTNKAAIPSTKGHAATTASPAFPQLQDTYVPPATDGGAAVTPLSGLVATRVRYREEDLARASTNGIHIIKAGEGLIEREELYTRTPEGFLRIGDCVIGVETAAHFAARRAHADRLARAQIEHILPTVRRGLAQTGVPVTKAEMTQRREPE